MHMKFTTEYFVEEVVKPYLLDPIEDDIIEKNRNLEQEELYIWRSKPSASNIFLEKIILREKLKCICFYPKTQNRVLQGAFYHKKTSILGHDRNVF